MVTLCGGRNTGTIEPVSNPLAKLSDEAIAAQATRGDRDAQAELIERYRKPVFGLCINLVGRAEAEDLAQDALYRVLTRLDSFEGKSQLGTWIYRLTTNLCLTHLRRRKRSPFEPAPDVDQTRQVGEPGPGTSVQTGEGLSRVRRALMDLPDAQRAILVLRDIRGLEYEQLAEALEIPVGTVRSRLFRARRALADLLDDSPSEDSP